jgi:polysaccharide deacetylase 2 family uncharacterized protein YibQ
MAANSFAAGQGMRAQTLALGYFGAFAAFLLLLGAVAWFGRPSDGDPVARIALPPHAAKPVHAAANLRPAVPPPAAAQPAAPLQPAVPVPPQVVPANVDKPIVVGRSLVADPALIEQTPQGPLPRIAADGRMPMNAYAPPTPTAKGPRIAIVIGDLGISAKGTAAAIQGLPAGITLAFAPYEDDVSRWAGEARRTGHEVLLEVPMEPYDFPDSDPGPHTLRAAVGEETNTERLVWSLTRFTGYAGITNFLGARFLSDSDSLEPVMTYVARRGLLFFDSSPQGKSVAPDVAKRINAPYVQSTVALDTIQTGMEIDARLSQLEQLARTNGSAAGTASASPVTVERIANWAKGLSGRGFVLVPASAIVTPLK